MEHGARLERVQNDMDSNIVQVGGGQIGERR